MAESQAEKIPGPFNPWPRRNAGAESHQRAEEETLRDPDPKADRQMLDEARWVRSLPEDLSQVEWLRRGAPKPRPDYRLPYKACWACGVRGHKRGSPDCRQPKAVVCFGCGEPGKTKATCPTCSELWESDEVSAGRRKARPDQYLVRRPEIVRAHQKAIHDAGWRHGITGRKAEE